MSVYYHASRNLASFGRQARPGEHVDSGLTAYRHSEFATLDKIRQKHKTRLGRFITSPRRLAALRLSRHHLNFHTSFWGPHAAWGQAPRSVLKTLYYSDIIRSYRLNGRNENSMRNILGLILLRSKEV